MNTKPLRNCVCVLGFIVCISMGMAAGETYIQDGAGFWWDFDRDGSVISGRGPGDPPDSASAFNDADNAARFWVSGSRFPRTVPQTLALGGRMLVSGPATMSGLRVMRHAYVPDTPGANWCCFIEILENPTGESIAVPVIVFGNLGSREETRITGTSSGGPEWTTADRWLTTNDAIDGGGAPSVSFNFWGLGTSIEPEDVRLTDTGHYRCDFTDPEIAIAAGETVVLMHFISQNNTDAEAMATATYLDALPAEALVGLEASNFGPVINWDISWGLDVVPQSLRAFSGHQGGPFTPDTHVYAISADGPFDWTVSGPAWVDIVPDSGSGAGEITVSLNAGADTLPAGPNVGMLTFSNTTAGEEVLRALRVDVIERLVIVETDIYQGSGYQGGPFAPLEHSYTLVNIGDTPLEWSTTVPPWLEVTPADHIADGGALAPSAETTITLGLSPAALALTPDNYTDTLMVHNDSYTSTLTRDVVLTVFERLEIYSEAGNPAMARGLQGGPFSPGELSFRFTNATLETPLNWEVVPASVPDWLDFSVSSGTLAPGATALTIGEFTIEAEALAPGDHLATLEFANTSYQSTVARDVILRVKETVYVDASAAPGGDGLSWGAAFNSIQDAIDLAATGDYWVWVAKGVYNEHITMAQGVEVHGGFTSGAAAFAERDLLDNGTVIDGGGTGRVVRFDAIGLAGISGVTIQNGYAEADGGGGIRMNGSENTCFIDRCIIRGNRAAWRGAGIYCTNGAEPLISHCYIFDNIQADDNRDFGGGIACYRSNPTIYRCYLFNNVSRYGAGIGCVESSPHIESCIITGNKAAYDVINENTGHPHGSGGGAIFAHNDSSPRIINCILSGNVTRNWHAGALYCQGRSKPLVSNCTISRNHSFHTNGSVLLSGFVVNTGSEITLLNSVVEGMSNIAAYEEEPHTGVVGDMADIIPINSLFSGNHGGDLRDLYEMNAAAVYTGGDELNAHVNGAHGNVAGGPDPQFKTMLSGQWAEAPVYHTETYTTTLTAVGAPFEGLNLAGLFLNANSEQWRQTLIFANTDNTIAVWGDITAATGVYGYAAAGDGFTIIDYRIADISPCIGVGLHDPALVPYEDLDHVVRGAELSIGAFENKTPSVAEVLSITPEQGPVSNADFISFEVIFSRAVTGLSVDNFYLILGGEHVGATIIEAAGADYRWTVTVETGTGNGPISLAFEDPDALVTDELGLTHVPSFTDGGEVYMAPLLHVTVDGAGDQDGSSWDNAFGQNHLQMALDMSGADGQDVWVAGGVYDPGGTIRWPSNAKAYGGFHVGDTDISQRDITGNASIITGNGERRVLRSATGATNIRIDGFTITDGYAPGASGAGIRVIGLDAGNVIANCRIENCTAGNEGGGILVEGGSNGVIIENCIFYNNRILHVNNQGGGLAIRQGGNNSATVRDCIFERNEAPYGDNENGQGGGMAVRESPGTIIERCSFISNSARLGGGLIIRNCAPTVVDCVFEGNHAHNGGGLQITGQGSNVSVERSWFLENTCNWDGAGADMRPGADALFINCIFIGNSTPHNGGALSVIGSPTIATYVTLMNCSLYNNQAGPNSVAHAIVAWSPDQSGTAHCTVRNTIIWAPDGRRHLQPSADHIGVAFSCLSNPDGMTDEGNNITGDPLFVDAGARNLQLQAGSPAINAGTAVNAPGTDIRGGLRPQGARVDMGAYEYTLPPAVAPLDLSATAYFDEYITLHWVAKAHNTAWFSIERRTGADAWLEIATVEVGITSYQDHDVTPSTTYHYRMRAHNIEGSSVYSNEASATTTSGEGLQVSLIGPALVTRVESGSVTFTVVVRGAVGEPVYNWYFTPLGQNTPQPFAADGQDTNSITLTNISANTSGYYWCSVSDGVDMVESPAFLLHVHGEMPASNSVALALLVLVCLLTAVRLLHRRTACK